MAVLEYLVYRFRSRPFFQDHTHRVFAGMVRQSLGLLFSILFDRKFSATAFAICIVPECLPRNAPDGAAFPPLPADVSSYSDNSRGVIATFRGAPPLGTGLMGELTQVCLPKSDGGFQRFPFIAIVGIAEVAHDDALVPLNLHAPAVGMLFV